jgi:hypothetical protein
MSTVNNGPQIVRSGLILDLDASYMRSYSPNVMPNPTNIFAWSGTGNNNCTLSGDTTITRQYGSIPLKMVMTGTDPYVGSYNSSIWNLAPAASGQTWTLSFYAKGSETLTGNCYIFGANSGGGYIEAAATSFTVTTSWQRFTFTTTLGNASTAFIQMRFGGSSGQVGKTIWWDGVQLERASAATNFNPYYFGNTSWRDTSGNGYNGTLTNGPTFNTSNKGSIVFDGVTAGQQVTVGSQTINFTSGGTFEMWTKINNVNRNQGFFSMSPGTSYINFYSPGASTQKMRWEVIGNVSLSYNTINSITTLQNNVWYHVVGNFDPSGGSTRIYINGSLDNSQSSYANVPSSVTSQIIIGSYAGILDGNIAIAKIYNRVLSAAEIMQNFQAIKTKFGL